MEKTTTFKSKSRRFFAGCTCCQQPFAATGISRRKLLIGGAAVGLAASGLTPKAFAQAKPHRIDVHCHVVPPTWLNAMDIVGEKSFPLAHWSVQRLLDDMDKGGVATAVTSVTTPQIIPLGKDAAIRISRESNDYAKKLELDHPGRFGVFAMLPLPHIDESLKEIAYAFDTLKVDGVAIMTSYHDKWLGYPEFSPIWQELNRRKAIVYTHPTTAACCGNLVKGIGDAAIEFGTDTVRSIANVIFSGTSLKYKDITWIWSHGGGGLTAFAERLQIRMTSTPPYRGKFTRAMVDGELFRFYYDTAQVANSVTLGALSKLLPVSQIVFGTDFPYRTAADTARGVVAHFKGDDLMKVDRENALRLVPRLRNA